MENNIDEKLARVGGDLIHLNNYDFHDEAYFEGVVKVENLRGSKPERAMRREFGLHLDNDGENWMVVSRIVIIFNSGKNTLVTVVRTH